MNNPLKMLGLGALAVSLEGASAPTTLRSEAIALSPSTIEALDELTVIYQRLYHSAAPADLLTPVRAHLQTTTELLRTSPARELRMRLLRNRSQVATLAGRLSFFDLQDALGARSYYNIALEAAREAGDDRLASNSLGHISFVPASEGSFAAAGDYLHGARQYACRAGDMLMTSWLAAVESELHTNGGEPARALAALDQAESALAKANPGQRPGWFDFYDGTRLAGFQGYAYLKLGRYDAALAVLSRATEGLPAAAVKQRTVFLTDLATVHVRHGDVDEGCRLASTAAGGLAQAGYATSAQRLREFRGLVEPWQRQPAVRELDERLASLVA